PVCVAHSSWDCTVLSDDTVRLGFCVVSGLRQERVEKLIRARQERKFASIEDFKRRVLLSREELRTLAELGALNCFAEHRRAAMWRVEETVHDDLLGSAGMLPAVRGILPRTRQSEDTTSKHNELTIRVAEEPSGNMPNGAIRMLALPT